MTDVNVERAYRAGYLKALTVMHCGIPIEDINRDWRDYASAHGLGALSLASGDVVLAEAVKSEIARREEGLEFNDRGDLKLYVVWALKPAKPQIICICRSLEIAERYLPLASQIVHGSSGHVEPVLLDHLFGRRDIQSAIYQAASAREVKA